MVEFPINDGISRIGFVGNRCTAGSLVEGRKGCLRSAVDSFIWRYPCHCQAAVAGGAVSHNPADGPRSRGVPATVATAPDAVAGSRALPLHGCAGDAPGVGG